MIMIPERSLPAQSQPAEANSQQLSYSKMKSMFFRAMGLVTWIFSAAQLHAEIYTFTDVGGRTMTAAILYATEESVRVKLKNGQEATIVLSKLIEQDQTYLRKWMKEHESELDSLAVEEENRRRSVELPLKLVAFCKSNLYKQVGNGECWTLADEAFKSCGLERPAGQSRVWGRLLDLKQENIEAGDIVEFRSAKFSNGSHTGPNHTAVVIKGGRLGKATIAEQNWGGKKTVRETLFDAGTLTEGEVMVYRPDYSKR